MRLIVLLPLLAALGCGPALAQSKRGPEPIPIPFEQERAKARGDKRIVRLNDDITTVPKQRIVSLPIVNGRMGEHVKLDGVELFFPFGRIVAAIHEFRKYREGGRGELDPAYAQVAKFDQALGPVCAREPSERMAGGHVELRIGPRGALSLVQADPVSEPPGAETHYVYRVNTATELRHLQEPAAARLHKACLESGRGAALRPPPG